MAGELSVDKAWPDDLGAGCSQRLLEGPPRPRGAGRVPVVPKVLTLLAVGWLALAVGCVSDRKGGGLADTAGAIHADTNTATDTATSTVADTGPDTGTDADPCDPPTEGCPCSYNGNSNGVCGQAVMGTGGTCVAPEGYEDATVSETVCDALDNDCDGITDEGCPCDYQDHGDGVCATATISPTDGACAAPETYEDATDAEAACDSLDNDCDGVTDEGCPCDYQDHGDGVCATATISPTDGACAAPGGYEATETSCDSVDNDCDGVTDEGCPCDYQGDSDGVCATATLNANGVCPEPTGYEATETACDGLDNDCDGVADEGCPCQFQGLNQGVCTTSLFTAGGVCGKPDGYEATEASCDGLDNDCDGVTDEGCTCDSHGLAAGVCLGAGTVDATTGVCSDPTTYEADETSCDGLDNDCDGVTDEGCPCDYQDHSDGVCATATRDATGVCQEPTGFQATETTCDGLDNDCDGSIDEGLTAPLATKQDGVCAGASQSCAGAGGWVDDYSGVADYEATEASCDGLDNDCDGATDEDLTAPPTSKQDGVCAGAEQTCDGTAGWVDDYSGVADYEATEASCDGLDNDCDGVTDEDLTPPQASKQEGVCAGAEQTCHGTEGWVDDYSVVADYEATEVSCDGLDNDCDGSTDEDLTAPPTSKQDGVCAGAEQTCNGTEGWVDDYSVVADYEATEASCDGLDNDCDGVTDEGLTPPPTSKQEGVCAGAEQTCNGTAGWVDDYSVVADYEATEASCDGLDNDCDGVADEGCPCNYQDNSDGVCATATISPTDGACATPDTYEANENTCDGLDNDCDGFLDEGCAGGTFVQVLAGTFTMGSPTSENWRFSDEDQHEVTLTRSFYMQETEATQGQWEARMGNNPSHFGPSSSQPCGDDCPVENVSWWEALAFANAVSADQGLPACYTLKGCTGTAGAGKDNGMTCTGVTVNAPDGNPYLCTGYRLPTEAEWEYAYRAGTTTPFYNGNITNNIDDPNMNLIGWYSGNASDQTHPAAQKAPNAWGLYDMAGNAFEWTWGWYGDYPTSGVTDPTGAEDGSHRVFRGGSWYRNADRARAACRSSWLPAYRYSDLGFRLARTLP